MILADGLAHTDDAAVATTTMAYEAICTYNYPPPRNNNNNNKLVRTQPNKLTGSLDTKRRQNLELESYFD